LFFKQKQKVFLNHQRKFFMSKLYILGIGKKEEKGGEVKLRKKAKRKKEEKFKKKVKKKR